jgi:2-iminobutanoate/2-iminopropanoate deaminase
MRPLLFHMIDSAPEPVGPFSHATEVDGWVLVTGQMPTQPERPEAPIPQGIEAQTRLVMENLRRVLAGLALDLKDVVRAGVYLTHFDEDYERFNRLYRAYFEPEMLPARTCIGVTALARGARVEVDLLARRPATPAGTAGGPPGAANPHHEDAAMTQSRTSPRLGLIDAADCILLVIDLQPGFLDKLSAQRREAVVDHCRFLVEVASRFEIPLFVTVEDAARNGFTSERVHACFQPGTLERDKKIFGLCSQGDLRDAILAQPRRTAILIGLDTDVCVLHSSVGLLAEGFRAVIVSDATEAPGPARDQGLARAAALGVEIVGARGLYHEWIRSVERLNAVEAMRIPPPAGMVI